MGFRKLQIIQFSLFRYRFSYLFGSIKVNQISRPVLFQGFIPFALHPAPQ
ncbi:unnamed protein product [Moneuplotes crassus]|uniref:Uncharacterized protein n=1 Tax=Euplotes crassus TaxID=5936 RepID=A0AAD1URA1_EUPCR|nr:unnamed protein product [Moneuplotes crassus]